MPRFYVKHEDKWNIFSTIVDDFILDEWCPYNELVRAVLDETIEDKIRDMNTLLTDKPRVNVMSYEEAMERISEREEYDDEEDDEDGES